MEEESADFEHQELLNFGAKFEWTGKRALPKQLFVEEGEPMHFFVYQDERKAGLCRLIESCGGVVAGSANTSGYMIGIVGEQPAVYKAKKPVYSHKWILHSILADQVLATTRFEVPPSPPPAKGRKKKKKKKKKRASATPSRDGASAGANMGGATLLTAPSPPARRLPSLAMPPPMKAPIMDFEEFLNRQQRREGSPRLGQGNSDSVWTKEMDVSLMRLVQKNQRQLDADPKSPAFWSRAQKKLAMPVPWIELMHRYEALQGDEHDLYEVQVTVERMSSSGDPSLSSGGDWVMDGDDEEDDHQSSSEDELDAELQRRSELMQESLVKMLSESASKPRLASRRLAAKRAQPSPDPVRKNLMSNGALPSAPLTVEETVARLAQSTGVSRKIAVHALLVNGGNVGRARRYLRGANTRPWTVEEDNLIRDTTDPRHAAHAVQVLLRTRTEAEIVQRCKWVEAQDEQKKRSTKQNSPRGGGPASLTGMDGVGDVNLHPFGMLNSPNQFF